MNYIKVVFAIVFVLTVTTKAVKSEFLLFVKGFILIAQLKLKFI